MLGTGEPLGGLDYLPDPGPVAGHGILRQSIKPSHYSNTFPELLYKPVEHGKFSQIPVQDGGGGFGPLDCYNFL